MKKRAFLPVVGLLAALLLTGCGGKSESGPAKIKRNTVKSDEIQFAAPQKGDTIAVFDTSAGEVKALLFPEQAPIAVENFVGLAEAGYYNGTIIYRAEEAFAVAGGDATGSGTAGTTIWGGNGYPAEPCDALRHYAGALCAAVDETSGSCFSAFYVVAALPNSVGKEQQAAMTDAGWRDAVYDAYRQAGGIPYLDYTDTVFGQVYEGMDAIDAMAQAEVDETLRPVEDITINTVTIQIVE